MMGGTFNVPAGGNTVLEGTARGLSQGNWTFLVNVSLAGEANTANNQGSYDFPVAAAQGGGGGQGEVTSVSVSVNPVSFEGSCPQTVTFNGSIKTNGPCTVRYQWVRGVAAGSIKSITFDAAGTQTVHGDWTLTQSGTHEMYLHIIAPNDTRSNAAQFRLTCTNVAPAAPSNLRVVKRTKNTITLKWRDNSDNEDGFNVQFRGGTLDTWEDAVHLGAGAVQCELGTLPCGTTFYFRVRAYNAHGESAWSNQVEGTTRDCN
jgi:hypothetical protein